MRRDEILAELDVMGYPRAAHYLGSMAALLEGRKRRILWYAGATLEQRGRADHLKQMEHELVGGENANLDDTRKKVALASALEAAGIPARERSALNDLKDTPSLRAIQDWWQDAERSKWLVLYGRNGVGKSVAGAQALKLAAWSGWSIKWVSASELGGLSPYGNGRGTFEAVARPRVLLIDEFGKDALNETAQSQLYRLLNQRHESMRFTIIISNLERDALGQRFGNALKSRIREDGLVIECLGEDLRVAA